MAFCLLLVFPVRHLYARAGQTTRLLAILMVSAFLVGQFIAYQRDSRRLITSIDNTSTIEYKIAKWLDTHLPGRRAMVSDDAIYGVPQRTARWHT